MATALKASHTKQLSPTITTQVMHCAQSKLEVTIEAQAQRITALQANDCWDHAHKQR